MPGRTSKLILAGGFVIVLALVIGLAQLTRGVPQAPALAAHTAPRARAAQPEVALVEPPTASAPIGAARESRPSAVTSRSMVATTPAKQPSLAPPVPSYGRELKRDANGKLVPVITVHELRDNIALADGSMRACIDHSGHRPTGRATLNFTVGAKNNQLVVETTGVQDEDTLAGYPALLECMSRTATLLLPPGRPVPELGTGIYVRRHVRIENGVLVQDSLFDFSYNP